MRLCWQKSRICCLLVVSALVGVATGSEDDPVEAYSQACAGFSSYDVEVTAKHTHLRVPAADPGDRRRSTPKPRKFREELEASPRVTTVRSRQVWTRSGLRRNEIRSLSGDVTEVHTFDGETNKRFVAKSLFGTVRGPTSDFFASADRYASIWRETPSSTGYFEQPFIKMVNESESLVAIHLRDSPADSPLTYVLWLDKSVGHMPRKIHILNNGVLQLATEVKDFQKINDNLYVPVAAVSENYGDLDIASGSKRGVVFSCELTVSQDRSKWNQEVERSLFDLNFPNGTKVRDFTKNVEFVIGEADVGKNIDQIVANSKGLRLLDSKMGVDMAKSASRPGPMSLVLVIGNIGLFVMVLFAIWYRTRKRA